ncbi:MAG TPA: hypothetical protein PLS39_03185 [Accumulibacter sp.]|nr:hypothetical protein [Accumulibacter sp.]HNE14215.1 hypothetical protein [Accumulibacter sp.]
MLQWLESPPAENPAEELPSLRLHLRALRELAPPSPQRAALVDSLYQRSFNAIASVIPSLTHPVLPITGKARRTVRNVLELLQALGDELVTIQEIIDHQPGTDDPRNSLELVLWRSLQTLDHQLMVSHMTASPPPPGVWQQLHQTFAKAQACQVQDEIPPGGSSSIKQLYHAAVLLGCAQPASLTAREVVFLAAYFQRFADRVDETTVASFASDTDSDAAIFWIDPKNDLPALAYRHNSPPVMAPYSISFVRLQTLLNEQIAALESATPAQQLNLPAFAGKPAGLGVLRRLALRWAGSGKRRFSRRKQDERTVLTAGLDGLWNLYQVGDSAEVQLSNWMITNESPDGYALMHLTGKTGTLSVGDIAAVRSSKTNNWQIGVVRWATSANPEHLEVGLQVLAPTALAAKAVQPSAGQVAEHLPVLVLPALPRIRTRQLLIAAVGAIDKEQKKALLVVEKHNLAIREIKLTAIDEQTSSVEILSIAPEDNPF